MPLSLFKQPDEKAADHFRQAYEKGVNLGPQKYPDAVQHFTEASKHYSSIGNAQKSSESYALATLFYALTNRTDQAWRNCSDALARVPEAQLDVGFPASSSGLARQAAVLSYDLRTLANVDGESRDTARIVAMRDLAQRYMDLVGNDLSLWRLLQENIEPQKRAHYLLGLASLIEANSLADTEPQKSVSLLSEAATNLELAVTDPLRISQGTRAKRDNLSKLGRCWFCGREMQGHGFHYVSLRATVSSYTKQRYGSSLQGAENMVEACKTCASTIRNVSDDVARGYFESAMAEMRALEQRLNARMTSLENEVHSMKSRLSALH